MLYVMYFVFDSEWQIVFGFFSLLNHDVNIEHFLPSSNFVVISSLVLIFLGLGFWYCSKLENSGLDSKLVGPILDAQQ